MVRDMRNTRPEKQSLTPMQKQAVLVCSVCALAAILTIAITMTLLKRGKTPAAPGEQPSSEVLVPGEEDISDHYQISETSAALLPETADAGESYQKETLFLGDSNTVRLYANGLISLQQFCAKEGIGTHAALNEGIVTFKKDSSTYTIAQAVAKMKPRRVVIMLGTNDTGMSVDEFIKNYTALVQAIQESYPYTDIIVNTVPPVPANHANYPHMDQTKIDDFNMALLSMCEQMGLKFLNSAEALKDANGYGREDYYQTGDIHLKPVGLKAMLSYLRTHAYQTDDRRPDTANIPTRAEYTPNPSSAVTAPSSSEAAGSSEEQGVLYQASYRVDKTGGTLSSGSDSGKTSLSYEVTSAAQSISVTAVPQDGYVFVKWSDGVTQKTRTDTNFKQNVDVTAVFAAASVHISSTGKAVLGDSYTFTAKLSGKHLTADSIRWYANGVEVPQAAGKTTVKVEIDPSMLNATFKVYAVASYNGCTVTSNVLNVTVSGVSSGSSSSQLRQLWQHVGQQVLPAAPVLPVHRPAPPPGHPPGLHPPPTARLTALPTARLTALPAVRARLPRQARLLLPTEQPALPTAPARPTRTLVRAARLPIAAPAARAALQALAAPMRLRNPMPARKPPTSSPHPRTPRPEAVTPACCAA